jgi:biotin carboxylase
MAKPLTILVLASYFKGNDFLRALKETGAKVLLITSKHLENEAWAREAIDEIFYVEANAELDWHMPDIVKGMAWMMRTRKVDRIVAMDDFDVEKGALLREEFRIPGMGQTTHRHFRDKLAMRVKAASSGISVPAFTDLFHDEDVRKWAKNIVFPVIVKPRGQASATGMKKVHSEQELWEHLETLGDRRHEYLVEQFKPGHVYHVDSITVAGKQTFSCASQYLAPPFDVAHGGGIFRSMTMENGDPDEKELLKLNTEVLKAFGMQYSASHTEFIKCHEDGKFYFLETSSRVGGAHLAEMVEAATGVNLWAEWARMEYAEAANVPYKAPKVKKGYAGIIVSLARQEWPDMSQFSEKEVVWRMTGKSHHVGVIVRADKTKRIVELLDDYAERVRRDYHASAPAPNRPTS